MIDFSTLQGLTIPEGVVKQIADASGRVLWSAKPSTVDITIDAYGGDYAYIIYNGIKYNKGMFTITANVGDVIHVWVKDERNYGAYVVRHYYDANGKYTSEYPVEVYKTEATYDYVVLPTTRLIRLFVEQSGGWVDIDETRSL